MTKVHTQHTRDCVNFGDRRCCIIAIMPGIISKQTSSYFSNDERSTSYNGPPTTSGSPLYEITDHTLYTVLQTNAQFGRRRR
jgi:hypothetical protein